MFIFACTCISDCYRYSNTKVYQYQELKDPLNSLVHGSAFCRCRYIWVLNTPRIQQRPVLFVSWTLLCCVGHLQWQEFPVPGHSAYRYHLYSVHTPVKYFKKRFSNTIVVLMRHIPLQGIIRIKIIKTLPDTTPLRWIYNLCMVI